MAEVTFDLMGVNFGLWLLVYACTLFQELTLFNVN